MHKGNIGFKSPVDTRITDLFKKAKELQAEKETAKSQEVSVVIESEKKISVTQIEPEIKLPVGYIGLTGISIKDDGVITKDQHMAKLSIDAEKYGNIVLTQEEATQVMKQMKRMTSGVNSVVALRCTGDMCAFKNSCVYYEIGKPPLGKSCLVEAQLIEYWTAQYFEEFNVDPSRVTEVHLISELAELDIYEMRVTKYLAENHPTLLQEMMTGVDAAGNVISNLDISRAFDLKERLKKQRMKVLEALMATRKEKIKAVSVVSGSTDTATKIAELKDKLDRLHRDVSNVEIIEGESVRLN